MESINIKHLLNMESPVAQVYEPVAKPNLKENKKDIIARQAQEIKRLIKDKQLLQQQLGRRADDLRQELRHLRHERDWLARENYELRKAQAPADGAMEALLKQRYEQIMRLNKTLQNIRSYVNDQSRLGLVPVEGNDG